jgi:hypothetical protein
MIMKTLNEISKKQIAIAIIVILILFYLSCLLLIIYWQLGENGIILGWYRITPPTNNINDLSIGKEGEVILSTKNGIMYEYHRYPQEQWIQVDKPSGEEFYQGLSCHQLEYSNTLYPPTSIKKTIGISCGMPEFGEEFIFVIDNSNHIWVWENSSTFIVSTVLDIMAYIAILVLLVILIILFIILIIVVNNKLPNTWLQATWPRLFK